MASVFKIYLDQMFGNQVATALREVGHDVVRASEAGQARADDKDILCRAISEGRILITLDDHFGDWVILPLSKHPGVIRLRINPTTSHNAVALLLPFLQQHSPTELENHLVIISDKRTKWIKTG